MSGPVDLANRKRDLFFQVKGIGVIVFAINLSDAFLSDPSTYIWNCLCHTRQTRKRLYRRAMKSINAPVRAARSGGSAA